jgi:type IV pilus assembly protein PilF
MVALRLLLGTLLVVVCSCATTTSVEDVKKAQAHYKLGVSQLTSGNIQPAFVEFQTALTFDPNNKEIHNALGNVYLRLTDLGAAEEHFQNATRIDPKYSDAHNNLCYVYYRLKQWDKAAASCTKALANPLYATPEKAFYNLGRVHYRNRNYDEAIKAYENALKRMPEMPNRHLLHYGIALCYNAKRDYGSASEAMTQAITLDPAFRGDSEKALAEFSETKGDTAEAEDIRDYIEILKY